MPKQYERPDPSAPPENKYAPKYPVCPECGEEIEYTTADEIVDCVDHLPVEVLPEACEQPRAICASAQKGVTGVYVEDYNRCKRALDRAVKEVIGYRVRPSNSQSFIQTLTYTKNRENSPKRVILREPERAILQERRGWGAVHVGVNTIYKGLKMAELWSFLKRLNWELLTALFLCGALWALGIWAMLNWIAG